jgi:hypothetical protein
VCRRNPKETFQINERQNRLRDLKSKCKSIWRAIWQCLPKMEDTISLVEWLCEHLLCLGAIAECNNSEGQRPSLTSLTFLWQGKPSRQAWKVDRRRRTGPDGQG